jgi:hypothetical protein
MRKSLVVATVWLLSLTFAGVSRGQEAPPPIDVGGGLVLGGYFGEASHDWRLGPGGTLFVQLALPSNFEARLLGAMQWSDGTRVARASEEGADLGGGPGNLPRSLRRTSLVAALLYRLESHPLGDFGVPYFGAGVGTVETRALYDVTVEDIAVRRSVSSWNPGVHGLAGVRLYRTSGLFLGFEGQVHGIDTPREWTLAYDAAVLLGVMTGS